MTSPNALATNKAASVRFNRRSGRGLCRCWPATLPAQAQQATDTKHIGAYIQVKIYSACCSPAV